MPTPVPTCSVVTYAVDLLAAAGLRIIPGPGKRIDRDKYEATISELADRQERRDGDVVLITGNHEDQGHTTTLRHEDGVFTIEAEEMTFVQPWGEPVPAADRSTALTITERARDLRLTAERLANGSRTKADVGPDWPRTRNRSASLNTG